MDPSQVPEYLIIDPAGCFFAPNLVPMGSKVRTWVTPHNGLEPLNEAAELAMDAWYNMEYQEADKQGKPLFKADGKPVMYKPHAIHRRMVSAPGEESFVEVIAPPEKDTRPILTLAEIQKGAKATDQRPGPQGPTRSKGPSPAELATQPIAAPDAEADLILPTAQVTAPPPSTPAPSTRRSVGA